MLSPLRSLETTRYSLRRIVIEPGSHDLFGTAPAHLDWQVDSEDRTGV